MIELDFDMAHTLARRAVQEKGRDYVYSSSTGGLSCYYVHVKGMAPVPGCIVGHILHSAGVSLKCLGDNEGSVSNLLCALKSEGVLQVDGQAKRFLVIVQSLQDNKIPWGPALDAATCAHHAL